MHRGNQDSSSVVELQRNEARATAVPVQADPALIGALTAFGRTEDLAVAPGSGCAVVAAFNANALGVVHYRDDEGRGHVVVESVDLLHHQRLQRPHGVAFLDASTIVVANREAELLVIELDLDAPAITSCRTLVDGEHAVPVRTPGSVAVRHLSADLVEILVCNNYVHDVTRYVLDGRADWRIIDADRLLAHGLAVPDGVAFSADGAWIAISNHEVNKVFVYRNDEALGPDREPDGVLSGSNYPHGLEFAPDGRGLLVADAGLPFVYGYAAADGDWSGERDAATTLRVMDDETFNTARYNPQEGGPKGLTVDGNGLVLVTGDQLPLAFLRLAGGSLGQHDDVDVGPTVRRLATALGKERAEVARLQAVAETAEAQHAGQADALATVVAERDEARAELATERVAAAQQADEVDARAQSLARELAAIESTATWRLRRRLLPVLRPLARVRRVVSGRRPDPV